MSTNKTKCLIIHGFGGGVYEVTPLADFLKKHGYEVVCPVLKGHSSTSKDMRKATYREWIDSAELELKKLKKAGDKVFLIGFSMGGLIAFNLANKHNIKGIITINTPIFYWNIYQVFINLVDDIKNKKCNNIRRYIQAKNNSPIMSMIQFLLLLHHTKPILEKIDCPVLILQAEDDDTVRRKSVDYINIHVTSNHKTMRYFKEGGHLILLSPIANQVMTSVKDFLQESN